MADINANLADEQDEANCAFLSWLKNASLDKHHAVFLENGIREISHLQDVNEADATTLGLTKFEFRRMARCLSEYRDSQQRSRAQTTELNTALYRPSTESKVVSLPPGMRNFVQTRDGMGNIIVSTKSLQRQFPNLWYESPVSPKQTISNTFILKMAAERLKFSKSQKDCEAWCRNQRPKRIQLIYGITKSPAIDNWSPHLKMQSVYGLIEMAKARYPEIVAFQNANKLPGRKHYDNVCNFVEKCQNAISLAHKNINICEREIKQTEKITEGKTKIIEGKYNNTNIF